MIDGEELKQLLQNGAEFNQDIEMLPEEDKTAIIELFKEPMKAVGKAIEKILKKECVAGEMSADIAKASLIMETLGDEYRLFDATYKSGISSFAFDVSSVKKMACILLETMPEEGDLSETELNAFGEIYSQMISSLANSLAKVTDANITVTDSMEESKLPESDENVLQVSVSFSINDEIDTTIYYYISYSIVNALLSVLRTKLPPEAEKKVDVKVEESKTNRFEELEEEVSATVQPICFEELTEDLVANQKENMNLLMDLQLQVSVELGKVKKPIKDILQFTQGTIVELDRLAGDNVDVLVSGKIIAKGEVVVVDQNFGVRITKIVLPEKRV